MKLPKPPIVENNPMDVPAIDTEAENELRARIKKVLSSRDYAISYTLVLHELAQSAEQLPEVFKLIDELRERLAANDPNHLSPRELRSRPRRTARVQERLSSTAQRQEHPTSGTTLVG